MYPLQQTRTIRVMLEGKKEVHSLGAAHVIM